MLNGYFISGTDTGVGKTLIAAILVNKLHGIYYKPIQCVYSVNDLFSEEYYSNFINLHNINHII